MEVWMMYFFRLLKRMKGTCSMTGMMIVRNLKLFFRDKGAVFFSLLSALILFVLYIFFLGEVQVKSLVSQEMPGTTEEGLRSFMNTWVFSGIVAITTVTTALAAVGVFVQDKLSGRFRDFIVTPMPRWKIITAYMVSAFIISALISLVVYGASSIYLAVTGAPVLSVVQTLDVVWRILLLSLAFSGLASLVATIINSQGTNTAINVITGTVIGFLAGVYVPLGVLPAGVANVANSLPFAQATVLIREPMAESSLRAVSDVEKVRDSLADSYGFSAVVGEYTLSTVLIVAILLGITLLSVVLGAVRISQKIRS